MSTPLTQFNYELLTLVFSASIIGTLTYLLLRLVEVRAPLVIAFLGLPSSFFLVYLCCNIRKFGLLGGQSEHVGWSAFFVVWMAACISMGARLHRPLRTGYGFISDALFMTGTIASGILLVMFQWDSSLFFRTYSAGIYFRIPSSYIALFFCTATPVATAFLLDVLHKSQYCPGIDRPLLGGEKH